jgi:hypothetical protein
MTPDQMIAGAAFFFITERTEHTESILKSKSQFSPRSLCSRWRKRVISR